MKKIFLRTLILLCCLLMLLFAGCDDDDNDDSHGLNVSLIKGSASLPSTITLNFGVETKDGEPVTDLTMDNFKILEDGEELDASESNITPIPFEKSYNMCVVLMLDLSGSVTSTKLDTLIDASKNFVDEILTQNSEIDIALYYFQSQVKLLQDITNNADLLKTRLDLLETLKVEGAATNLYGAFIEGLRKLDEIAADMPDSIFEGSLAVYSDGKDNTNIYTFKNAKSRIYSSGYDVFAIGLATDNFDEETLRALGKDGFSMAQNASGIPDIFDEIATSIVDISKQYYEIKYCTSKRDTQGHKAELSVTDNHGRTGSTTFLFTTLGFEDGCYQEIEDLKLLYYDKDNDGLYSVEGPLQDDNDAL